MRKFLIAGLVCILAHANAQVMTGRHSLSGNVSMNVAATTGWAVQPSIPAALRVNGGGGVKSFTHPSTKDLFNLTTDGTSSGCTYTAAIWWAPAGTNTWQDISGSTLPQGCFVPAGIYPLPNGTILVYAAQFTTGSSGNTYVGYTVFGWNGLTGASSAFTQITGGPGQGSNAQLQVSKNFTANGYYTRSDGVTCLAGGEHIFCNASANSLAFTRMTSGAGLYVGTSQGAVLGVCPAGSGSTGFIYPMDDFDAGDGRGEQVWAGGEGSALEFSPFSISTLSSNFVGWVPNPNDCVNYQYTNNVLAISHGPTSALIIKKTDNNSATAGAANLTHISFGSPPVATIITPAAGNYLPYPYLTLSPLFYVSGTGATTRWVEFGANGARTTSYIWYSSTDGSTFVDLLPSLLVLATNCTSGATRIGTTDGTKIYVHCLNGSTGQIDYWQYTP